MDGGSSVLRRTTVVAMLRRSTGADAAARRATDTADRCKNIFSGFRIAGFGGERCSAGVRFVVG